LLLREFTHKPVPFRRNQPQTFRAVSTTNSSFRH
jgi:hypothetical protein